MGPCSIFTVLLWSIYGTWLEKKENRHDTNRVEAGILWKMGRSRIGSQPLGETDVHRPGEWGCNFVDCSSSLIGGGITPFSKEQYEKLSHPATPSKPYYEMALIAFYHFCRVITSSTSSKKQHRHSFNPQTRVSISRCSFYTHPNIRAS